MPKQKLRRIQGSWVPVAGGGAPFLAGGDADTRRKALPDNGDWTPIGGVNIGLLPSTRKSTMPKQGSKTYPNAQGPFGEHIIVKGIWFTGTVTVAGGKYLFENCLIEREIDTSNVNIVDVIIEDCEVGQQGPTYTKGSVAIKGHHTTCRRVWVHHMEDAFRPYKVGMTSSREAVDLKWVAVKCKSEKHIVVVDTNQSDGFSHCDSVQLHGGTNVLFSRCILDGHLDMSIGEASNPARAGYGTAPTVITSVVMCSPALADYGRVTFDRCVLSGGYVGVNINAAYGNGTREVLDALVFTNNDWGTGAGLVGKQILRPAAMDSKIISTGNHYPDGTPYNARSNG